MFRIILLALVASSALTRDYGCLKAHVEGLAGDQGCAQCKDLYGRIKPDGKARFTCQKCTKTNCANCDSKIDSCATCASGFYRSAVEGKTNEYECKALALTNCARGDKDKCSQCITGYVLANLKDNKQQCIQTSTCAQFDEDGDCKICVSGYFLQNAKSLENSMLRQGKPTCVKCKIENCVDCSKGADKCETCALNTFPKKGIKPTAQLGQIPEILSCNVCDKNCFSCDQENDKKCKTCNGGFKPKAAEGFTQGPAPLCVACEIDNCDACSQVAGEKKCITCKSGYRLKDDATCEPCKITGCTSCQVDAEQCMACPTKFFNKYENTKYLCGACQDNCDTCENNTLCWACSNGYRFGKEDDEKLKETCVKIPFNWIALIIVLVVIGAIIGCICFMKPAGESSGDFYDGEQEDNNANYESFRQDEEDNNPLGTPGM